MLLWFFYFLWLLTTSFAFFIFWTDYVLDIWIVTNKRIIDIEQIGLFKRETSSVRLENIQDVTCNIHGLIPTILHYGEINLQTSGTEKEFILKHAASARKAKELIMRLHDQILEEHETVKLSPESISKISKS